MAIYEEKSLRIDKSESECALEMHEPVEKLVDRLSEYDIISFDIFDTLIFRPFTEPTDLFYFVGNELGMLDFKRIRMELEAKSRHECFKKNGHYEVTFSDVWKCMERETGIPAYLGMKIELSMERKFCYANPYMLKVFRELQKRGKKIIIVSDMYLPERFLSDLLQENGYSGFEKLYVSCEYGKSKAEGSLYDIVKADFGSDRKIIHVGDNEHSDVRKAKEHGFSSAYYPNVNKMALSCRPYDMSPVIGGAYRGIVDNYLYQGLKQYSMEYEYGFIYGGLFVVGYCHFIHEYCRKNKIDKILFLSRDGDILKQVYDRMYPQDHTSYVYWSRAAATKLMAKYNRYDYFRRYINHKVNQKKTLREILDSMELLELAEKFGIFEGKRPQETSSELYLDDYLTDKNADVLKKAMQKNFNWILKVYKEQFFAAKDFYKEQLTGCKKACAVDIGWAGSGAVSLAFLAEKAWKIPCELIGIIAGTNTVHNAEPDASEGFLQSGKLVSYLFSQSKNRDLMKKHDLNKDYNVYWELLLSSPEKSFKKFVYNEENDVEMCFGKADYNVDGIREIQKGIRDFAEKYIRHFKDFPWMFDISGRDAYAPMLVAAGHNEKYLKEIAGRFRLDISVT